MRLCCLITCVVLPFTVMSQACAKDIVILCSTEMQPVLEAVRGPYEARSGDHLVTTFEPLSLLKARLDAGAPFDLVILNPALVAELVRQGRVIEGSAVTLARASDSSGNAVLTAGLATAASDRARAEALLAYLRSEDAAAVVRAKGLEPG